VLNTLPTLHRTLRIFSLVVIFLLSCTVFSATASLTIAPIYQFDFDNIPLSTVLSRISQQTPLPVIMSSRELASPLAAQSVTLHYSGDALEPFLDQLAMMTDTYWTQVGMNAYSLSLFRTLTLQLPTQHQVSFSSVSSDPFAVSDLEVQLNDYSRLVTELQEFLSIDGAVTISESGLLTVRDRPSVVDTVSEIALMTAAYSKPVCLTVRLAEVGSSQKGFLDPEILEHTLLEWKGQLLLGSTLPLRDVRASEKTHETYDFFLTPSYLAGNQLRVAIYAKSASKTDMVSSLNEINTTVQLAANGHAIVSLSSLTGCEANNTKYSRFQHQDSTALVLFADVPNSAGVCSFEDAR
jgi:hypothetical protein